ncbi:MAG: suppressor of fused domain protein [Planctomycetota bacterium]
MFTDPPNPELEDVDDEFWNRVYSARAAYYREHIGELPDDILKIGHMFGVWPGGGLYVIPATKLGQNVWAYSTFGFTNPDMPASVAVSDSEVEHDDQGRVVKTSSRLEAKERAASKDGAAGYGYEMLVLTKENAEWPLWFLQWVANAEILNDAGILERVETYEGLTVEEIKVGETDSINVLIAKSQASLPTGTVLPNGKMNLLVATSITDDEMEWSMENGRDALLEKLQSAGVGQFSDRKRTGITL